MTNAPPPFTATVFGPSKVCPSFTATVFGPCEAWPWKAGLCFGIIASARRPSPKPPRPSQQPSPKPRWTWTRRLHQYTPELFWAEDPISFRWWGKNIVKYVGFVLFAYRNYILQHGENCVNTSVFARRWHKNTVNTVIFATRRKKMRKYRGFGLPRHLRCFLLRGREKCEDTTYVTVLRVHKNATIRCVARTKRTRTRTTTAATTTTATATTTTNSTEMRQKMCCNLRYKKHIILCSAPARARRAHEQHQPHTTIHNPYDIASVRSSTIKSYKPLLMDWWPSPSMGVW